tara:strand:- start:274 stop:657 length:384 start_codon:yes stop_codon:yes gene_type:complete
MTNYNPPTENLTNFNPSVFEDNFTTNEVDTKLKNLETNKIESAGNLYIERGQKTSSDATGIINLTTTFTSVPSVFCQVEDNTNNILKTITIGNATKVSFNFKCIEIENNTISIVSSPFFYTAIGEIA